MKNIAIIDIGTNTFHLLIASEDGRELFADRTAVKLGKGGINKGIITKEAYKRAMECLEKFKVQIDRFGVKTAVATATSAVRNASNGEQFVKDIERKTGIRVLVISGDKEAELIYEGVRKALNLGKEPNLIIDIGGGSVEFIIGNQDLILWKGSFEIGAQRLLELFHKNDPITSEEILELQKYVHGKLQKLDLAVNKHKPRCLVGSSGTFDTLSEMDSFFKNRQVIYSETTEYSLSLDDYYRMYRQITEKAREERLQIPGMAELRVDMIVVACCLIDYIIKAYEINHIRVSAYALKDGVLQMTLQGKL